MMTLTFQQLKHNKTDRYKTIANDEKVTKEMYKALER